MREREYNNSTRSNLSGNRSFLIKFRFAFFSSSYISKLYNYKVLHWFSGPELLFIICRLQIDVSFSCVCPVIDHEFRHNIAKVAVDPRGDSRVNAQRKAVLFSLPITYKYEHTKLKGS